jgi:hypothetical protein
LRFPNWRREYESALLETDKSVLFRRVEVAEAAILARRDALEHDSSSQTERGAMEDALAAVRSILKRDPLHFGETESNAAFSPRLRFRQAVRAVCTIGGVIIPMYS